jgi:hypothetical protein
MIASQNPGRNNTPLALRLKIDDLHAHLALLDRYGPTRIGSALVECIRALHNGWRRALRGVAFCCE